MGHELDQVSMEIGKLNAKVESIEANINDIHTKMSDVSEKIDSYLIERRETKARIIGMGAGLGIAGGSLVQVVKGVIDKVTQ